MSDNKRNTTNKKPLIGISIGDMNGVGIEVIMKTFSDDRIFNYCTPIVYGSSRVFSYHRKVLLADNFNYNIINSIQRAKEGICNIFNCWTEEVQITIGRPSPQIGSYALKAIEAAVYDVSEGKIDAMITAPVNKATINNDMVHFPGHTEYITQKFEDTESLMFLVSDNLRVGLVTNHIPISEVSKHITKKRILEKINIMDQSLRKDFAVVRPKIAVLSLNPHAGDGGLIGEEDDKIVRPAVVAATEKNLLAFGPYSADGFFGSGLYKEFDGILAMYHDQGLVAFKALSFGNGVNFTAGLPIVRTSPDHGTAYNIAGKNQASPDSFRKAVFLALDVIKNRKYYAEITKDPLVRGMLTESVTDEIV